MILKHVTPTGGLSLASFRLAQALQEAGNDVRVLYATGDPPDGTGVPAQGIGAFDGRQWNIREMRGLLGSPDLIVLCDSDPGLAQSMSEIAPTVLYSHLHWGLCADESRYWNHLQRPCRVRASWGCAVLRPTLGCSDLSESWRTGYIARQMKILANLTRGTVGVLSISSAQSDLYQAHGVPKERIMVAPSFGMRLSATDLGAAADATPDDWRHSTAFIGRLSKAKGAGLLPKLDRYLGADGRLRVFGDGYLRARIDRQRSHITRGQISQIEIAGVLMWARSVVFPSLWPEPGGIVGIDAQVAGVPLAAFAVGAALDWPDAAQISPRDVREMSRWAMSQTQLAGPRDPDWVAHRQDAYWCRLRTHVASALDTFRRVGSFEHHDTGSNPCVTLLSF
jgi:glycosyltransferase involved in cell wall biosynthesis